MNIMRILAITVFIFCLVESIFFAITDNLLIKYLLEWFTSIRLEKHLTEVFNNNPKYHKSSYRYFSKYPHSLAINSGPLIKRPGEHPKKYLITVSGLKLWLLGLAKVQKIPIENFCVNLKAEFKSMETCCFSTKERIKHAKLCIEMLDEFMEMLEEEKTKCESGDDFSDAYTRAKEKCPSSADKIKEVIENLDSDVNPEIFKKIREIEKQMVESKHFSGTNRQQWLDIIKPNIVSVASKKHLNEESKQQIMSILNTVTKNIIKAETDFSDMETAATISSVQSFMDMNGWYKYQEDRKGNERC